MKISQVVHDFIQIALQNGAIDKMDVVYQENQLLAFIGESEREDVSKTEQTDSLLLLDALVQCAEKNGVLENGMSREILEAKLMDFITPLPSVVNQKFHALAGENIEKASQYFFNLSKANNYIQTRAISKNIEYTYQSEYGEMEITINLSKPEKDPKEIAKAKLQAPSNYPKCQLCMENEGYLGRSNHPARSNHRIVRLNLNGKTWGFQYSPYAYYNEHSILLNTEHIPMVINQTTIENLFNFIEVMPHYMIGSNADLPIVGGSILTHDHYQAGRHEFPMAKAEVRESVEINGFPNVNAGILNWPMSVIRLSGSNQEELIQATVKIMDAWKKYSDPAVEVVAVTEDGVIHHTITPIVRKRGSEFEIDIVLRDNNVSEEHPDGIFHPHQEVQHIKQENIGLIEVMGLAILPPRLKTELIEVEKFLLGEENEMAEIHHEWAKAIKEKRQITKENVGEIVKEEVGKVFVEVLTHAGVFKDTTEGHLAFRRFINSSF